MEIKDFKSENYYVVSGQAETGGETVKITCKGRYPEAEKLVYQTILARFLVVFCSGPCLAARHKVPTASMVEKLLKEGQIRIKTGSRGKKSK